jgi:TatD DNase family protein
MTLHKVIRSVPAVLTVVSSPNVAMTLIDTHCHLYLPEFDTDRDAMLQRAEEAGVKKFFLPNIDSGSVEAMNMLVTRHPETCLPMMGLHPCSVKENWSDELSIIEKWLFNPSYRWHGIGETGLDYYWDKSFIPQQKENFQRHIEWAKRLRLPIIIHSRDALDDCIEMIRMNKDETLTGIFHCFSGTAEQARQIRSLDFCLGIGGVVTFKNGGLDNVFPQIGLNGVVLETDSPYLAPVPFRGKRNESSYLKLVVKRISELLQISGEEVALTTTANANQVFQLQGFAG